MDNYKPNVDGKVDCVVTAHWDCTATDGTYSGRVYSTTSFEVDADKPDYIPYADLTEAQVVQWVQASLGAETVAATETNVLQQIETQKTLQLLALHYLGYNATNRTRR